MLNFTKLRKRQNVLTMMCLGVVGSLAMLLFIICVSAAAREPRSGTSQTSTAGEILGAAILILLVTSVGWWVVARIAGALWRMNTGLSWKFMMCTGALGLVLSALFCDVVVLLIVRRLYVGDDELRLEILRAS